MVDAQACGADRWLDIARERYPGRDFPRRAFDALGRFGFEVSAETIVLLDRPLFGYESGFLHLPVAQVMAWGVTSAEVLDQFVDGCALSNLSFLLEDDLVDGALQAGEAFVVSQTALLAALGVIEAVAGRSFAANFLQRYVAYHSALKAESRGEISVSPSQLLRRGDKAAPLFVGLEVAAAMTRRSLEQTAISAIRHLCAGLQLCDDLHDVSADLLAGQPSSVVALLKACGGPDLRSEPDLERIAEAVFVSGVGTAALRLAHAFVAASARQFLAVQCLAGHELAVSCLDKVGAHIAALEHFDQAVSKAICDVDAGE